LGSGRLKVTPPCRSVSVYGLSCVAAELRLRCATGPWRALAVRWSVRDTSGTWGLGACCADYWITFGARVTSPCGDLLPVTRSPTVRYMSVSFSRMRSAVTRRHARERVTSQSARRPPAVGVVAVGFMLVGVAEPTGSF